MSSKLTSHLNRTCCHDDFIRTDITNMAHRAKHSKTPNNPTRECATPALLCAGPRHLARLHAAPARPSRRARTGSPAPPNLRPTHSGPPAALPRPPYSATAACDDQVEGDVQLESPARGDGGDGADGGDGGGGGDGGDGDNEGGGEAGVAPVGSTSDNQTSTTKVREGEGFECSITPVLTPPPVGIIGARGAEGHTTLRSWDNGIMSSSRKLRAQQ